MIINKARRDLGRKSCDVMSDSDSEITFEMNAFYPQIPAFAIPSMKNNTTHGREIKPGEI